jgi:hypothetical protein
MFGNTVASSELGRPYRSANVAAYWEVQAGADRESVGQIDLEIANGKPTGKPAKDYDL